MSAEGNPLQFPLHVSTEDEEFVIEKDGDDVTSPSGSQFDDQHFLSHEDQIGGVRLKRRRRCGQCGPCQVKENCNKCHYCLRKDVLKQTCVYRKCIYLRSKPKPYQRQPKEVIPLGARRMLTSPASDVPRPTSQQIANPLFPDNNGLSKSLNSTVSSPPLPFPFSLPNGPSQTEEKFKPTVSIESDIFPNPAAHKSHNAVVSIPGSTNNHQPLIPSLSSNTLSSSLSEFSNSSFPRAPLHVPFPHTIRESQSLMQYPAYGRSMVNEPRPEVQSPCMYSPPSLRPPLPSSMSSLGMPFDRNPVGGYFDRPPNGPTYLPNTSDLYRPYTSIPSASPGYPYPSQTRFSHNPSPYPSAPSYPGYSGLGMHPSLHSTSMPANASHYGAFQTPSFPSNQSIGCPKNGQCPPASQTSDTHPMQEKYGSTNNSKASSSDKSLSLEELELAERTRSVFNITNNKHRRPSSTDISRSTHNIMDVFSLKDKNRLPLIPPAPAYCANMPPWDMFNIYRWSKRPASVLSDDTASQSVTSSDFECDVISIDDFQINAMIRSDGCNSIQIEYDDRSSESSRVSDLNTTGQETPIDSPVNVPVKITIKGSVHLKQDLGDEGIIQLELPGNKVTLEESILDNELASYSCDLDDLTDFISKEPNVEILEENKA